MKHRFAASVFLVAGLSVTSAGPVVDPAPYADTLRIYVADGKVDYADMKANRAALDRYVASLADVTQKKLFRHTPDEQKAFWINTYNALTLQLILDHYPLPSITNLNTEKESVWQRAEFTVAGNIYTLDKIEHGILRVRHADPYLHMVLVCAAVSCPPLRAAPYKAPTLDAAMRQQADIFLRQKHGIQWDATEEIWRISRIFNWFTDDFKDVAIDDDTLRTYDPPLDGIMSFIARHTVGETRERLSTKTYQIEYLPYNWSLNDGDVYGH